jgi:hypothetical protein
VPAEVFGRFGVREGTRAYLETPFDSFWYLGERLGWQTRYPGPVVPLPPPRVLFEQTPDPVVRFQTYQEGQSDTLVLPGEDYQTWAWRYLACGPIEVSFCSWLFLL